MPSSDNILAIILGGGVGKRLVPSYKRTFQTRCAYGWKIPLD